MKKTILLISMLCVLIGISAVTLDEGFEGTTFPPAGWSIYNGGDANTWVRSTSAFHLGTAGASIAYGPTAHRDFLITPKLRVTGANHTFSFSARSTSSSFIEHFNVKLSTATNVYTDFNVTLAADVAAPNGWTLYTYDLSTPTDYVGQDIYLAIEAISTDQLNLFVDDVTGPDIWVASGGVLSVLPNPIVFGNVVASHTKTIPVTLSNTGVADLVVNTLSLATGTKFTIPTPPSLPLTLIPGGASTTFDMVYTPTVTGSDTDVLNIGDSRSNTSYNVSGTSIVGDICAYPYLATLPLVNYAGNTAGFANDYTSAMFTGLSNPIYVSGHDWVAKITIPAAGGLNISLADQAGYSYQYMGVYLVNTIPSIASPAELLAEAYAYQGTVSIVDAEVAAGDYYVIVDNWPIPYNVYFVLNITYVALQAPPIPDLSIACDGTLSWTDVGCSSYNVYSSNLPYSGFTRLTTISGTSWLDPTFPVAKKFYRVTAGDPVALPDNFVLVEGGTFNNGSSNVSISSFYMDKYELTQSAYQAVMGMNPGIGHGSGADYPVYYVSWFKAIEYCNRRSLQEGLSPCYSYSSDGTDPDAWPAGWNSSNENHSNVSCDWSALGYRLPTEMEWMFAAKGGVHSQNYTYSGSNDLDTVAWNVTNADGCSHPVGLKTANELGFFDMNGNVWELSWDIYGDYSTDAQTNPHGASTGEYRAQRGGSWGNDESRCNIICRGNNYPTSSLDGLGFRVCRPLP